MLRDLPRLAREFDFGEVAEIAYKMCPMNIMPLSDLGNDFKLNHEVEPDVFKKNKYVLVQKLKRESN